MERRQIPWPRIRAPSAAQNRSELRATQSSSGCRRVLPAARLDGVAPSGRSAGYSSRSSKSPASTCVPGWTSTSADSPVALGVDRRFHLHRFQREQLLARRDHVSPTLAETVTTMPGIGAPTCAVSARSALARVLLGRLERRRP